MNCREFETVVGDLARGRGLGEAEQRTAAAHARECAVCGARLVEEWEVTNLLGHLSASTAGQAAPQQVEAALLNAFDRQRGPLRGHGRSLALPRWAFALVASTVAVAAFAWLMRPKPVAAPSVAAERRAVTPAAVAIPAPVAAQIQKTPQPPRPVVRVAKARPRPRPRPQVATRFYPLAPEDAVADMENGTIVRIGMPRSALTSFGWPLDPDHAQGHIEADVVLDNDTGMARAIRFVSSRQ